MTVINTLTFISQQLAASKALERSAMPALLSDLSGYDGTRPGPAHFIRVSLPTNSGMPALVYPFESDVAFHNATLKWLRSARRTGLNVDELARLLRNYTVASHRATTMRYAVSGNAIDLIPQGAPLVTKKPKDEGKKPKDEGKEPKADSKKPKEPKADSKKPKEPKADSKKPKGEDKPVQVPTPVEWSNVYRLIRAGVAAGIKSCSAKSLKPIIAAQELEHNIVSVGRTVSPHAREVRHVFDSLGRVTAPRLTVKIESFNPRAKAYNVRVVVSTPGSKRAAKPITGLLDATGKLMARVFDAVLFVYDMAPADVVRCANEYVNAAKHKPDAELKDKPEAKAVKPATSIADAAAKALESGHVETGGKGRSQRTPTVQPTAKVDVQETEAK